MGMVDRMAPFIISTRWPVSAEALANLGYCDEVDSWVDTNIHHRRYGPLPEPGQPIRLALAELPASMHGISLQTMVGVNREIFARFGGRRATVTEELTGSHLEPQPEALAAQAAEIGDEHAIKLCEAAIRENTLRPDPRYFAAASTALALIRDQ